MDTKLDQLEPKKEAIISPLENKIILNINRLNENNAVDFLIHQFIHETLLKRISLIAYLMYDNISKYVEFEPIFNQYIHLKRLKRQQIINLKEELRVSEEIVVFEDLEEFCYYSDGRLTKDYLCLSCNGGSDLDYEYEIF